MSAVDVLRPPVRRVRAWANRHNGRLIADLQRRYDLNQWQRFETVLNRHGRSLRECASILEFGCGEGRLIRRLFDDAPTASIWGCDVRRAAVAACRRAFPKGRFVVNRPAPPLEVDGRTFDLIYSYSVFTHLSEPNHLAWLRELAGRLAPGGMMLHTVHSYEYVRRTARFSPDSLAKYHLQEPVDAFLRAQRSYVYIVDHPSTPEYGHAIMRREYVQDIWPRETGLAVLEYVEGAIEAYPEGCQDLVLLGPQPREGGT